jgi:KaiC/GvpD/RAD55 family RecA-like ATPase
MGRLEQQQNEPTFRYTTAKNLFIKDLPPIDYLVDKIIIKRGLVYVYGPPASFKTNFLLYVALKGHEGQNVLNFEVKEPFKTLWIDEENGAIGMKDKLTKIAKGNNIDLNMTDDFPIFIYNDFKILSPFWINKLILAIEQFKPELVVIDSVAKVFTGDERHEKDVAKIFNVVKPIIEKHGVTIVLIHHSRKFDKSYRTGGLEDISGSREFAGSADIMLYLQQFKDNFALKQTKNRYGEKEESINFTVTDEDNSIKIEYAGSKTENVEKMADKIKADLWEWMLENPSEVYKTTELVKVMKEFRHKETNTRTAIKLLAEEKVLKKGRYGEWKFVGR